ncbi:single-stranded DNA-binding protein [Sulfobacillus thermosulfidooxidans]|uniref:single-stranded DNA-binding protein n=1 Tax=Sulfobacillus thermosulfidooxidans TaxID=28034 RepID=UPI0006B4F9B7|nr:single-stranded DNA-binding protein [Sulfobacillus thermosulfidooxidans]
MNQVELIGRLTQDPALRYTFQGTPTTSFTVAVPRPYKNAQGQYDADFIPVVTWRKLAEHVGNYLRKGRLVAVTGRLQVRSYTAKDGSRRWITEVIADSVQFLDGRRDDAGASDSSPDLPPAENPSGDLTPPGDADSMVPDDLPF